MSGGATPEEEEEGEPGEDTTHRECVREEGGREISPRTSHGMRSFCPTLILFGSVSWSLFASKIFM